MWILASVPFKPGELSTAFFELCLLAPMLLVHALLVRTRDVRVEPSFQFLLYHLSALGINSCMPECDVATCFLDTFFFSIFFMSLFRS